LLLPPLARKKMRSIFTALAKAAVSKVGLEIHQKPASPRSLVTLPPGRSVVGRVLLSASLKAFEADWGVAHPHEGYWTDQQMARCFLERDYAVDIIDYRDASFVPSRHYEFFVDCYQNLERIAPWLSSDCLRIFHIETAHWSFQNWAEYNRQRALIDRRAICLPLKRQMRPHWAIEAAHCAVGHGNGITCGTYNYALKPIYRVPISAALSCRYPDDKDWDACRKRYVWFGNHGFLLKGLDLVLEAFERMPDYHLTVCGPLNREQEFCDAYRTQLFETPNIAAVGFVDVASPQFLELTSRCVGLIYPSASEGQSGGVVMCMQTGLIPVVSNESGVDVEAFGVVLDECSIDGIQRAIRHLSSLPARELEERSLKTWRFARENHSRERCAERWQFVVDCLIRIRREGLPLPQSL
jgi:glycosyltransferase involved in cell wall biosynthesis